MPPLISLLPINSCKIDDYYCALTSSYMCTDHEELKTKTYQFKQRFIIRQYKTSVIYYNTILNT